VEQLSVKCNNGKGTVLLKDEEKVKRGSLGNLGVGETLKE